MAKKDNNYYFDSFAKGLGFANQAAELLHECLVNYDPANVRAHLDDMHEIEHTADGVKHAMMDKLMKEFLPPIEREDIVELAHIIDDVTDSIEDVLRGMFMYNVTSLRPEVSEFTELITHCCKALIDIAGELANFRKSTLLPEKIIELNDIEEEGDRLYTKAMHRLYAEESDPITVMKWTTMYNLLENCCDCCENVADMVEQIIMKNS